ncbi:amidohydrolase [soil metagenome]
MAIQYNAEEIAMVRLLFNADVRTLDAARPEADALVVRDGKILAVGREAELRRLAGPDAVAEDMHGAVILPGLTDAHIHWEWTSLNLKRVSMFDLPTKAAAVAAVAERVRVTAPGEWITGFGWAQGPWTDTGGAFPTAADLDAVAPDNPLYLSARSGHATWVNSAAMKIAGITAETKDSPGAELQRDAAGNPTGILLEEASLLVARHVPKPEMLEIAERMREAQVLAWKCGLTGIHDYDRPSAFEAMQYLHERHELGLRVLKHVNDPHIPAAHELRLRFGFGDDWLHIGGLKIFADGALGPVTALMIDPYEGQPNNRGIAITSKEEMMRLVPEASRHGMPSTIHAIGDKAVRDVLDVYEFTRAEEAKLGIPRSARRHRIEHVQIIHPDDVHRLAELDIIASIQPIHATSDYPVADRYWGDRAALSYNARVQLDRGVRVAFGSDSPVESFDPFVGIHAAVTRQRADGSPGPDGWYPEARLTVDEAIRGYTQGPAWASGMENKLGTLKEGFLADLIVIDRDPWKIAPADLLNVKVLGTMVGGEWVWKG